MKSTKEQLCNRGYLPEDRYNEIATLNLNIDELLNSRTPSERTFAIGAIRKNKNAGYIAPLVEMLRKEKALYTKIELCECLAEFGTQSISFLIPCLGMIGNNQHKKAALIDFNKKSFPLPRDIVARTIIRIGTPALPYLKDVLLTGNRNSLSEAIDAIGHITSTTGDYLLEDDLINLHKRMKHDELIAWKLIRCFQAFESEFIFKLLNDLIKSDMTEDILRKEAERSLSSIRKRITVRGKYNHYVK